MAIGSHDNGIYVYRVSERGRKYNKVGKCFGHTSFVTHLDWSSDSQYLRTNSGDYEILYWTPSNCKQCTDVQTMKDLTWHTDTCVLGYNVIGWLFCSIGLTSIWSEWRLCGFEVSGLKELTGRT